MRAYLIRRLLLLIPVTFGVVTVSFILIKAIPGDPIDVLMGMTVNISAEEKNRIRDELGLNDPMLVQYGRYISGIAKGDLGNSIQTRAPVTYEIAQRLPDTLILTSSSMLIVIVLSIPLGILSAIKRGTWIDTAVMTLAMIGVSMPAFWFGIMLMLLFGLYLDLLPTMGQGKTFLTYIQSLILPSVTLSLVLLGLATRMVRSSMLEVLKQDYVRTAHAKGLAVWPILMKHALPNAFIPVLTVFTGQFAIVLGGAVIIEAVFAWPGLGRLAVMSIFQRDYLVVTGTVLVFSAMIIIINLINDILYSVLDPRVRTDK